MMRSTPLCKQHKDAARSPRVSAKRLELEAFLSRNLDRTWTLKQMREHVDGGPLLANYVETLRNSGKVRLIGLDEAGHRMWVWHTSKLQPERKSGPAVAGTRSHVNAAMPNGDASYWARAMSWGR